ncbi:DUF4214 domain-containing protein [Pseudoduganella sp. GCM10020061]|uniref:DUF4214 domain-containing protein n=1 Tax=Pseudoduganella sp. GCM10020061 TaxID=3317345 RepID=UPI00363D5841
MIRHTAAYVSHYMYPDEPNTTYDQSTNTTMARALFTTTAKHIVGTFDHTGGNYFMFNAGTLGQLHLNYVHPAAANGAPVYLQLYDANYNLVMSKTVYGSEMMSYELPTTGLYYLDVRASSGAMSTSPYAILPSITNATLDHLLNGSAGNDVFTPGAGNETIVGNGGFDIVRYPGLRADSLVTFSDAGLGIHTVGQGKDTLIGIERLEFSDLTLDIGVDSNAAKVYRVYDAVFNRTPDAVGIGFWIHGMDKGVSLLTVASHFMLSDEFTALYGANPTVRELVTGYYRNILDREPEQEGIDFWMGVLESGRATSAEVLVAISESAEHQALLVGQVSHGVAYVPYDAG